MPVARAGVRAALLGVADGVAERLPDGVATAHYGGMDGTGKRYGRGGKERLRLQSTHRVPPSREAEQADGNALRDGSRAEEGVSEYSRVLPASACRVLTG